MAEEQTPEYSRTKVAYKNMKSRCKSKLLIFSRYYRDKGITVCQEWRDSFENFLADMKFCPENKSLDRVDNSKGYYKENCRWASKSLQSWNRDWGDYKGVSLTKSTGRWRARISYGGKTFHLGYFADQDEAKRVYDSHAAIIDWLIEGGFLE